jgi:hypothetical protein
MYCPKCRFPFPSDAHYCPECGTTVDLAITDPTQHLPTPATATNLACPKCQHAMLPGFLLDFDDRTGSEPGLWVAGYPERHPRTGHIIVPSNALYQVVAHRCTACGYVELYAQQKLVS